MDVGDPQTWPSDVAAFVDELAMMAQAHRSFHGSDTYAYDMKLRGPDYDHGEAEVALRSAVGECLLLAYHATRLLPHEVDWVRRDGLMVLSEDLRHRKLAGARHHHPSLISADEQDLLEANGPMSWQEHGVRRGLLWVITPIRGFQANCYHFGPFLNRWGGESIFWADGRACEAVIERLTAVSTPTVIEVGVPVTAIPPSRRLWPVLVGAVVNAREPWTEVHITAPVPPEHVVDLISPGHPRWPEVAPPPIPQRASSQGKGSGPIQIEAEYKIARRLMGNPDDLDHAQALAAFVLERRTDDDGVGDDRTTSR